MTDIFWECEYFFVPMNYYLKLRAVYPRVDIEHELNKMYMWLDANPKKTKKNYKRFVINWLGHAEGNLRKTPQHIYLTGKRKEVALLLEMEKVRAINPEASSQVPENIIRNMAMNELKKKGIIK